jgi:hypothetical protein
MKIIRLFSCCYMQSERLTDVAKKMSAFYTFRWDRVNWTDMRRFTHLILSNVIHIIFIFCILLCIPYNVWISIRQHNYKVNNTGVCLCSFYYHYMFRSLWNIVRWSYQFTWIFQAIFICNYFTYYFIFLFMYLYYCCLHISNLWMRQQFFETYVVRRTYMDPCQHHKTLSNYSIWFRWVDTITWWWSTRIETCSDNKNYVNMHLYFNFIVVLTDRNAYVIHTTFWKINHTNFIKTA